MKYKPKISFNREWKLFGRFVVELENNLLKYFTGKRDRYIFDFIKY